MSDRVRALRPSRQHLRSRVASIRPTRLTSRRHLPKRRGKSVGRGSSHTEQMVCMFSWSRCEGRRPRRFPVQSALYEAEHEAFRAMVRDFLAKEVVPHHAAWEEAGIVDRSVWLKAGEQGLLGMDVPEQFGGGGVKDFRYNAVLGAEVTRVGASGLGFTLH